MHKSERTGAVMVLKRSAKFARIALISVLVTTLAGCATTTQISFETRQLVCETAKHYKFQPSRATWPKLQPEEQAFLKDRLADFREEGCPEILK
jgi:hypothetical protein